MVLIAKDSNHLHADNKDSNQGPVVQSVVSLTVLADSMHNILIFFAEKMRVATHIFTAKNFSIFAYHSM